MKYSTALKATEYDETKFTGRFMHFASAARRTPAPVIYPLLWLYSLADRITRNRHGPFWREWVTYSHSLHFSLLYSINSTDCLTELRDVHFVKVLFRSYRSDKKAESSVKLLGQLLGRISLSKADWYGIVEASNDVDISNRQRECARTRVTLSFNVAKYSKS